MINNSNKSKSTRAADFGGKVAQEHVRCKNVIFDISKRQNKEGVYDEDKGLLDSIVTENDNMKNSSNHNTVEEKKLYVKTSKEVDFLNKMFWVDPTWSRKTVQICKKALKLKTDQIYKWGYDQKKALQKNKRSIKKSIKSKAVKRAPKVAKQEVLKCIDIHKNELDMVTHFDEFNPEDTLNIVSGALSNIDHFDKLTKNLNNMEDGGDHNIKKPALTRCSNSIEHLATIHNGMLPDDTTYYDDFNMFDPFKWEPDLELENRLSMNSWYLNTDKLPNSDSNISFKSYRFEQTEELDIQEFPYLPKWIVDDMN